MKKALLMMGGGYHPFESCAKILAEVLETYGTAACTVTDDRDAFTKLSGYDVVIVYTQGGELAAAQEKGLCDWVEQGGAFVGIHCADDSWVENERYMEMIGTQFTGHGPVTEFKASIADPDHEITRSLSEFTIVDEFYIIKKRTEADLHWVLKGSWHHEDQPLAYVREYGKGRVFYTALGHDERAFRNPGFQQLIHRGIWWATGSRKQGPVRCGVIGYGPSFAMGKVHCETIQKIPGLKLAAVCDIDPARCKAAEADLDGIKTYPDAKTLAASGEIDLGVIVTPHDTHAEIALELLNAGIGVISEKPFSITIDESTKMIEAARKKNLLLSTFHNRRWDADFLTIRKIIDEGWLGEVFHTEAFMGQYAHPGYWWRSHKPISGGAIYDWGAHFTDWILNIMPYRMESVTGFMNKLVWHDVTNEDHCKAIIRFDGGRSAELEISSIAARGKSKFRILGTKGALTCEWEKPIQVTTYVNGTKEDLEVPLVETRWALDYYIGIVDHLLSGAPLQVTPESARRVIAVLELAERSSTSGKAESVPHEDEVFPEKD